MYIRSHPASTGIEHADTADGIRDALTHACGELHVQGGQKRGQGLKKGSIVTRASEQVCVCVCVFVCSCVS